MFTRTESKMRNVDVYLYSQMKSDEGKALAYSNGKYQAESFIVKLERSTKNYFLEFIY